MSDEALEFSAKLSHVEKTTLRGIATGDAGTGACAAFLADLGLASGPDEKGIYVLSPFGADVLAYCDSASTLPSESDAPGENSVSPSPAGG